MTSTHYSSEAEVYREPDAERFRLAFAASDGKLRLFTDDGVNSCISSATRLLKKYEDTSAFLRHDKETKKFVINLFLDQRKNFHYEIDESLGTAEVFFFAHVAECNDLANALFDAYYTALHELIHIEFFLAGLIDRLTPYENEYWATRLSHCAFISHPDFQSLRVYRPTKTENARRLLERGSRSTNNASAIGATLFQADLHEIVADDILTTESSSYEKVRIWCEQGPPQA